MGGSSWSDDFYTSSKVTRAETGTSAFAYSDDIRSGKTSAKIHEDLNPMNIARESRDSDEHPNSNAIAIMFDVTGSMGRIPIILQDKLGGLMGLLVRKGYIEDPQLLFGAIGDYRANDKAPIQIGQFESGNEMEGDLSKIYIESGGGGNTGESYDLAMYFFANKTSIDCLEKRNEKGYLFTIGDEPFFDTIRKIDVSSVFGDSIQEDIPVKEVIAKLQESYNYFHILPMQASWSSRSKAGWIDLLGQHVLILDNSDAVCETIALAIGVHQDSIDIDDGIVDLTDAGYSKDAIKSASRAVSTIQAGKSVVANGSLPPTAKGGSSTRI